MQVWKITRLVAAMAVASMLGLTGLAGAGAASAATRTTGAGADQTSGKLTSARLVLDCAHMSPQTHKYAVAHRYCPLGGSTAATPNSKGEQWGDCGDSWIEIDNEGGGYARFTWGFDSSLGAVSYRSLQIDWLRERFGNYGHWPDGAYMFSSSYSGKPRTVSTGTGYVSGDLNGYVDLWWGGSCDLLVPQTEQQIT